MRVAGILVVISGIACGDAREPCSGSEPGLHFLIHLPPGRYGDGLLGVTFAGGQQAAIPLPGGSQGPWESSIDFVSKYPAGAVTGAAEATFTARPDPGIRATVDFSADLSRCVTVEMQPVSIAPDAGVGDAGI